MNANFALGPNFVAKYIYIVTSLEEPDLWLFYLLIYKTRLVKQFELRKKTLNNFFVILLT